MRRTPLLFGSALIALSLFLHVDGFAQSDGDVVIDGGATFPNLFAVITNEEGIVFVAREPSATCGIPYHVQRFGEDPALIALISDPPPRNCRGKLSVFGVASFSYEELGLEVGELFQVLNPIEASRFDSCAVLPSPRVSRTVVPPGRVRDRD